MMEARPGSCASRDVSRVDVGHCSVLQVAVEKYEEVLHNLAFAQELHESLEGLTETVSLHSLTPPSCERRLQSEAEASFAPDAVSP